MNNYSIKNKNIVLIIISFILISSCESISNSQAEISANANLKVLSISDIPYSKMSEIVDSISYIKLENHSKHSAHRIDKVIIEDKSIYMFDYYSGRSLSVFDINGNFQFAISNSGNGPDQYLEVQDFLVVNGKIEILDALGRLVIYDNKGIFERSEKLPFIAQAFSKINNKYLFQTGKTPNTMRENGDSCELIEYDLKSKSIKCILEIRNNRMPNSYKERNVLKEINSD
jgi:hypothetical protein